MIIFGEVGCAVLLFFLLLEKGILLNGSDLGTRTQ